MSSSHVAFRARRAGHPSTPASQHSSRPLALLATLPLASPASARRPPVPRSPRIASAAQTQPTRLGISYGNTLVGMSPERLAWALDDAVDLGVRWIRADLSWTDVQPTGPATYRWEAFDRVVTAARARGLEVLPILAYTPAWARDAGCERFSCPPRSAKEFATFAREAVSRYGPQGVQAWEVWNEPNFTTFWPNPDAGRYAALLDATSRKIHRADKSATMLLGGLAAIDPAWAPDRSSRWTSSTTCATSAPVHVSAASPTTPTPTLSGQLCRSVVRHRVGEDLQHLTVAAKRPGRPRHVGVKVWATEDGAPTGGNGTAADGTWASLSRPPTT